MVFVWRGSGITVPIFLFISGWIVSYWIEDTTLGNSLFIGWTMLWAGIILTLQGVAVWGGGKPDPDTGEILTKKGHDFFWIPVVFWGLGFLAMGIWKINVEPIKFSFDASDLSSTTSTEEVVSPEQEERMVNFYNPYNDSVFIELTDAKTNEYIIGATIPPVFTSYKKFEFKRYDIEIDGEMDRITVSRPKKDNEDDYDEIWYIIGGKMDLVLVDVTDACDDDMTIEDITSIDWTKRIEKRYDGDKVIEPTLVSTKKKEKIIYGVGDKLPKHHRRKEFVYALIAVGDGVEPTDAFLDKKMLHICEMD